MAIIKLINVEIISNKHTGGDSLISVTNAVIYLSNFIKCTNNSYYGYIFELHFSIVVCKDLFNLQITWPGRFYKQKVAHM